MRFRKPSKYHNRKVIVDGVKFDSLKEYRRYTHLLLHQKAGLIKDLKRQVTFDLIPAVRLNGRLKPMIRYKADFTYYTRDEFIVEDVKSEITRKETAFRMRLHLMKWKHGIEVKLT